MLVFSGDASQVIFASNRQAQNVVALYRKPSNGVSPEQLLLPAESGFLLSVRDWSLDDRWLVYDRRQAQSRIHDIWYLDLKGDGKPKPYIVTPYNKNQAALAPNSRWLAYVSGESGAPEVTVQPFPDPSGGRWKISTGTSPRWRRDGSELYYLDLEGRLVAVSVGSDNSSFSVGTSTTLFKTPPPVGGDFVLNYTYDVSPDGQHFLVASPLNPAPGRTNPITVIQNWLSLLKR